MRRLTNFVRERLTKVRVHAVLLNICKICNDLPLVIHSFHNKESDIIIRITKKRISKQLVWKIDTQNQTYKIQGVPKKVSVKPIFEFETLGGVFLGVKNNSKNFGNKNNSRFFSKILSKWTLFSSKPSNFLEF